MRPPEIGKNPGGSDMLEELVCSGFEEFAHAVQGADSRVMLAGPEESAWWVRVLHLPRLSVQVAQEGAANIYEGASWPDSVNLLFALTGAPFTLNGADFGPAAIGVLAPSQPFATRATGRNVWTSICVPVSLVSESLRQSEPNFPDASLGTRPSVMRARPLHRHRLKALVERVTARDAVATLEASTLAARAVEDELLYAVALALDAPSDSRTNRGGRPTLSRRVVVDRALSWIAAHDAGALHVSDLSRAAGVSERTLRNVFVEYFGIGPLSYMRTRQLHQVHAALSKADPARTTVTSVAMQCGVWDLEAMASRYRRVFNETPVMTLRKERRRGPSLPMSAATLLTAVR